MIQECFKYNQHFVAMMNIINLAKIQNVKGKFQRHHIIPRCFFKAKGLEIDNSESNLVNLTYEQHKKVHELAVLCANEIVRSKLVHAVNLMKNEHRADGIYNGFYNKKHTEETKEHLSKSLSDKRKGENNPMYGVHPWNYNKKLSDDEKKSYIGHKCSEETRNKISLACSGEFGRNYYEHYHMTKKDNVKLYYKELAYYKKHNKFSWEE